MIEPDLKHILEKLDQMIKSNLENELPLIKPDFKHFPTYEMVESNINDHIKNFNIDMSYLPNI